MRLPLAPKNSINWGRSFLNGLITVVSALLCLGLLPVRLPGMELVGIGPDWPLLWVVTWSLRRTPLQGLVGGVAMGWLQDALTNPATGGLWPTHAVGLSLVGWLTARLEKDRLIQEDFVSVALIVFAMAVVNETAMALQWSALGSRPLTAVWTDHQRLALGSAVLSSLWAPIVYLPLSQWWKRQALT